MPISELEWIDNDSRFESLKLLYAALPIELGTYESGWGILNSAAHYAEEKELSWLLEHGADGGCCNEEGRTLLHVAASCGNYAAVRALVKHRGSADLEVRDAAGWTPLHVAAFRGFAYQLQNGRPKTLHSVGWTPLHAVGLRGFAYMLQKSPPETIFSTGCMHRGDYYETIAQLMYAGADTAAQTADGRSLTAYELAKALGPEERLYYLDALGVSGNDILSDADEELFWDTCNGNCSYGSIFFAFSRKNLPTITFHH